jgi:hypothetical protein
MINKSKKITMSLTLEDLAQTVNQLFNKLESIEKLFNEKTEQQLQERLKQGHRKSDNEVPLEVNTYSKGTKTTSKYNNQGTTQIQKVYNAFYESPKTMKEVDAETGIMRANICRYCSTLVSQNKLFIVGKRRCNITKSRNVIIYTSNPGLAPNHPPQLSLF